MKRILFLLVVCSSFAVSQVAVKTEVASQRYWHSSAATTGDTLTYSTLNTTGRFLGTVVINTAVSQDTIIFKNGTGTVATIIFTSSPPVIPLSLEYNVRCDTSLILIKKKASDITIGWRGL